MEAIHRLLRRAWWRLVVIDLIATLAVTRYRQTLD